MSGQNDGWRPNGRPQSMIAQQFSAALDDIFKLNGLGALETSLDQRSQEVQLSKFQIHDLDTKLKEADERLKRLEAKHRRQSQMISASQAARVAASYRDDEDSSGDSDAQGRSSPQSQEDRS